MSIRKPIIKVTRDCPSCKGEGSWREYPDVMTGDTLNCDCSTLVTCEKCKGVGKVTVKRNNKDFKKYYIENLEEVIGYWTKLYRNKNKEAQEYLKKVSEYSKELDKVVNK